jgi:hypothetical protein
VSLIFSSVSLAWPVMLFKAPPRRSVKLSNMGLCQSQRNKVTDCTNIGTTLPAELGLISRL